MSARIPDKILDEIFDPVVDQAEPAAERMCEQRNPNDLAGSFGYPTIKSDSTQEGYGRDVPRGADVQTEDTTIEAVDYVCKKQVGKRQLDVEDEIEADRYDRDAVAREMEAAMDRVVHNINVKLADGALDTGGSKNVQLQTTNNAKWSDGGSSSFPYEDLSDAAKESLFGDTVIMGTEVLEQLRQHPDTKEQDVNVLADGQVSPDVVKEKVRQAHSSIQNVYVFDDIFDTAAKGLSFSRGHTFEKKCWVGHKEDLVYVNPDPDSKDNPGRRQSPTGNLGTLLMTYQFCDFLRPRKQLGVELTEGANTEIVA